MANFIWTGILYFSTSMIVYIIYRTFMNDRRAENERRMTEVVNRSQAAGKISALDIAPPRQPVRRPAVAGSQLKVPAAAR
jgi:hypothetical protein